MPKKPKAACTVHDATYLGKGQWSVEATYDAPDGVRHGLHAVEAPKKTTRDELGALVAALY